MPRRGPQPKPGKRDWFVIQTTPQCETKATGELRRNGIRVYLPKSVEERRHRKTGEIIFKRRALFVGYLLIRFPEEMLWNGIPPFGLLRDCQGVRGILREMNSKGEWEPFPVPNATIADFMRRQRGKEFDGQAQRRRHAASQRKTFKERYNEGRKFKVSQGPFAGFMAKIKGIGRDLSVETEIQIFGRATIVSFDNPDECLKPLGEQVEAA